MSCNLNGLLIPHPASLLKLEVIIYEIRGVSRLWAGFGVMRGWIGRLEAGDTAGRMPALRSEVNCGAGDSYPVSGAWFLKHAVAVHDVCRSGIRLEVPGPE